MSGTFFRRTVRGAENDYEQILTCLDMLSLACSVMVPGRACLRCLIDLTVRVTMPHHRIRESKQENWSLKFCLNFVTRLMSNRFFIQPLD